ncbi:PREDICTED: M-phase phosphoprotein 6-like [Chrysochloris asiatica]|uniref:M-phase phosphoprotein 6-like n=1 Tax=Chrysochloris asiatica TaxID=185453 RepID=A0A9B0T362_CHRAS|nr:PREDICTED: M-phase phosphoprotein 6-like [Chrysochloris asiatica]
MRFLHPQVEGTLLQATFAASCFPGLRNLRTVGFVGALLLRPPSLTPPLVQLELRELAVALELGSEGGVAWLVNSLAEHRPKLSKNLLRMKFMQRGLDSETKKQLEEEEKKIISDEHWFLDLPELKEKESLIIEEQSFSLCEDLLYGRMSFRGFNSEVEKLMVQMNSKSKAEEVEDEAVELDVSDEEMARRYESLVGTIGKKFAKKRDRANFEEDENGNMKKTKTKKVFLKPQE